MTEPSVDETGEKQLWRPVDPRIWTRGKPQKILGRLFDRITGFIAPFFIAGMVVIGPLSILISIAVVYSLVPLRYFGVTFIAFWAIMTVAFVKVLEKTGYAKNFEAWNFPLRRIAAIPIAFLMVLGLLFLVSFLEHRSVF